MVSDEQSGRAPYASLIIGVVVALLHREAFTEWFEEPFLRVRIVGNICRRIIRDDVVKKIFGTDIVELVRLVWWKDEAVTGADR